MGCLCLECTALSQRSLEEIVSRNPQCRAVVRWLCLRILQCIALRTVENKSSEIFWFHLLRAHEIEQLLRVMPDYAVHAAPFGFYATIT